MKSITNNYKTAIKEMGREIDAKITYTSNGDTIELGSDELNSISLHYEGNLLKSIMKQLDIDSNVEIPLETEITAQFGVLVNGAYEYITLGTFIVYTSEKQEDLRSYKIVCYDKLLYSMIDYEDLEITYPITIRNFISTICTHLGLTFANASDTFVNYDKEIDRELYLDENGNSLNYTFRDVLDELSQVTASNICINNDDELEVRYINQALGKNLFDKNNVSTFNGIINYSTSKMQSDANNKCLYIPITGGNTYTVSKTQTDRFSVATTSAIPTNNMSLIDKIQDNSATSLTLPTSASANYLVVHFWRYSDTKTQQQILDTIQIEVGNTATDYEPYGDTIDEEYLKNINVNFGEVTEPINTITFKRSADSDIVSLSQPADLPDADKHEIVISDNQILNGDNRADFLSGILTKLYGLSYALNDYASTGITYYEPCDKYNVSIDGNIYTCIMFNDEINITQGLTENIHTDRPDETKTDYNTASKDDRTMLRTELVVNKQEGKITGLVSSQDSLAQRVSSAETTLDSQGARLDIATTNIDPVTGDILALKRTNYEFGANGIIIDDEQGFKSVKNTTGDYYYENDEMIGKYTKDGSVQKDIALFGRYYYGIDENLDVENFTKDDAMFVGQLYEDNNNEQSFGHFWNRD